jgi:patatin-related protein
MSDAAEAHEGTEFSHEVRLGLVLYGGVSLAIYMNGTTNELHRAVRGRGVYYLLKHLLDADITVDVASGASAGGINGIFLSFALANEREFGTCAELWRRDGDLGSLFRTLEGDTVPSVLDSEHYRDVLENGFRTMWRNDVRPVEPECPSETRELDLFVTGTSFYGRYAQAVDSTGRVIETKQHRTVFLLKHRQRKDSKCQLDPRRDAFGRWEDGQKLEGDEPVDPPAPDTGLLALAKLAQITSCFPGAFAAVHVDTADGGDADRKLEVWGMLPEGEHYFVDGGVLDNKPFTTTLDAIFHRPAHRRVCRHVLYLEPDPERFSDEIAKQRDGEGRLVRPSFLSSVLDSVTRLPSYESIADDLGRISEHNTWIQRFNDLVRGLQSGGAPPSAGTYVATRLLAIAQRVNTELAEALAGVAKKLDDKTVGDLLKQLTAEVATVSGAAAKALLAKVDVDFYIRRLLALTYELEKKSEGPDGAAARELWKQINQELQWLEIVRSAMERVVVPPGLAERIAGAGGKPLPAAALWSEIRARTLMLLDPAGLRAPVSDYPPSSRAPREQRASLVRKDEEREQLRKKLDARLEAIDAAEVHDVSVRAEQPTLLEESRDRVKGLVATSPPWVAEFLDRFEQSEDPLRFPLEFAAGVHQRDVINVVRLSPLDAQTGFSERDLEDKICGETFGHFGAFLKKSWRSNDILWGRLDGISRLVETLLGHTPFGDGTSANARARLLEKLSANPQGPRAFLGALFPRLDERLRAHSTTASADPLERFLALLRDPANPPAPRLVQLLTELAQLDALCEDVPKVIADAAEEQLDWGQRKVTSRSVEQAGGPGDPQLEKAAAKAKAKARKARIAARKADERASAAELDARKAVAEVPKRERKPSSDERSAAGVRFSAQAWEFEATSGALTAPVLNLATRQFAEHALGAMSVGDVARYFQNQYAVGSESAFRTIPVTVLADLGARGAVLAESALVGSNQLGQSVRDNGLYRLVVHFPLRIIAALAAFLRRSPEYRRAFVVGAVLYALLALVANVLFAGALYGQDGFKRTVAICAFLLIPASALTLAWLVWRSFAGKAVLLVVLFVAALLGLWWKRDLVVGALREGCVQSCDTLPKAKDDPAHVPPAGATAP